MALASKPAKPDRNRIDLTEPAIARQWTKKLGRSREEIAAAIEKVGDNCDTVKKELGVKDAAAAPSPAQLPADTDATAPVPTMAKA